MLRFLAEEVFPDEAAKAVKAYRKDHEDDFDRDDWAFLLDHHRCHLNQPRLDCSDRQTLSFSSAGEDLRRFRSFPPREEKVLDHHGCVFS